MDSEKKSLDSIGKGKMSLEIPYSKLIAHPKLEMPFAFLFSAWLLLKKIIYWFLESESK